ncbi:MAG: hypothetical protein GX199_01225 [Firmicutes bacterium]|nr:hypothetical protein [Bacillota bacterium]
MLAKGVAPLIWNLAAAAIAYFAVPVLLPIYRPQTVQNYLGEPVPTGLGSAFLLPVVWVLMARSGLDGQILLFACLLLLFGVLGAVDDACGSSGPKGFRGHFRYRSLSTGALKAMGGGISALAAANLVAAGWVELIVDALLVALAANFINLLDLRPGRAGKAFLLFSLPLHFAAAEPLPLQVLSCAVLGYLPWDLKRKAMMGDTGANPLGAALGWLVALNAALPAKVVVLIAVAALNLLSERVSYSEVIARNRFLHFLDQLGR